MTVTQSRDLTKPFIVKVDCTLFDWYEPGSDVPWMLWIPPTGPECYEGGDELEGALLGPWGESFWDTHQHACEFLAFATQTTTVQVFGVVMASYQNGKVTSMKFLASAEDAGRFRSPAEVYAGDHDLDVDDTDGPFWRAISEFLSTNTLEWQA